MGQHEHDRLKSGGLEAKRADQTRVWIGDISFAPKGHALEHPRAEDPADEEVVESIVSRGFLDEYPIVVREVLVKAGKKALYVIDGSRRTNAGQLAEKKLKAAGKLPSKDPRLFVPVIVFDGDDAAAIAYRLRANVDPLKKPDSPSVLATTFRQLAAFGWKPKQIAEAHGRIAVQDVEALLRFETLPKKTRQAFDEGTVPLRSVADFLDKIPTEGHAEAIATAGANGGSEKPRKARKAVLEASGVKKKSAGKKMRKRTFLEKWVEELKKKGYKDLVETIEFILGGDALSAAKKDKVLMETLETAGYKVS
jgi:ParB-like chromosome segregation protein Spo0J